MTVQQLLKQCSIPALLTHVVSLEHSAHSDTVYTAEQDEQLKQAYISVTDELVSMAPADSEYSGYTILGYNYPYPDYDKFGTVLVENAALADDTEGMDFSWPSCYSDITELTDEQLEQKLREYYYYGRCGYEYNSWAEVLSFNIYEPNLNKFDKEQFMAEILYNITFCGYTSTENEQQRMELKKAVEEAEQMMHDDTACCSYDELCRNLGIDVSFDIKIPAANPWASDDG